MATDEGIRLLLELDKWFLQHHGPDHPLRAAIGDAILAVEKQRNFLAEFGSRLDRLERERWIGPPRLGPRPQTQEVVDQQTARIIEAIKPAQDTPPVDRAALCTTNGKPVAEVRAGQTAETGQHDGYIVLCPDERAKGFVRPYRDAYKHVGRRLCGKRMTPVGTNPAIYVCTGEPNHDGDCCSWTPVESVSIAVRAFDTHTLGGCGTVTTMGRELSETYARDPKFYGATFCCGCNRHLPVAEFVWTADGAQVGS